MGDHTPLPAGATATTAPPEEAGRPAPGTRLRPVWAEVDVAALRHNAALLRRIVAPAELCAVVKADGYGHGAPAVARAALAGGASWLAVALVEEGMELRAAGVDAPVLVLSEPPPAAMAYAVAHRLTPTVYSRPGIDALALAARGVSDAVDVHVKVDTGMHRVGIDPAHLVELCRVVAREERLRLAGLWTHLAVAEGDSDEDRAFTAAQLRCFGAARAALSDAGLEVPFVHVANSAGALVHPQARLNMVRCGIALYGVPPAPHLTPATDTAGRGLRPALSVKARVSWVQELAAGERPSYGRAYRLPQRSRVATVPIGYADGVARRYFSGGGEVLVGGRRRPLAGNVTMDQIVVDCGPDTAVSVGDEVVLLGRQGDETVTAWDWAQVLGTIGYEVLCAFSARVPRVVMDEGGT